MDRNRVIPKLRGDIVIRIIEDGKKKNILLYDQSKIANQPLIFPVEIAPILQYFDGKTTLGQLEKIISQEYKGDITQFLTSLDSLIDDLNLLCYLETPYFFQVRDDFISYINSPVRPPICVGHSYPLDKGELNSYLQSILTKAKSNSSSPNINCIIAPHIDFLIGEPAHRVYAEAYRSIKDNKYDVFVIFGTSHYGTSDYFMFTYKDFETPLGIAKTEKEFLTELSNSLPFELTIDEQAHRFEHSIEFQVVLLQYVFQNPQISIIPILVGPFHEFFYQNSTPLANERIKIFVETFRKKIFEKYEKPLFVASVDFSHFGRKFHDPFDGMDYFDEIHKHDKKLIELIQNCNPEGFFNEISKVKDRYKVCGLSPIYSILSVVKPRVGKFLAYDFWDDSANKSIVTFASFCFE
ncbi:MAG: AmmeMemoRadiSam system protein B [Ignavibacteria bacterium]|nr:AmmeMemoRadiSam system protein B [Ignavibacteria bacterium]